jgi:hypothetical protein
VNRLLPRFVLNAIIAILRKAEGITLKILRTEGRERYLEMLAF